MPAQYLKPNRRYLAKLRVIMTIVAVLVMVGGAVLAWVISLDEGPRAGSICLTVFLLTDILWWIPAMILAGPYYNSLKYEIQDDEVIVHVGIWTKSVKHVPYRTVTNIKINRGILDRYVFNIGTLNIQTAGMSGSTGAEESLVGLENVQDVYDVVVKKLRLFRGGMTPTAAEVEERPDLPFDDTLNAVLNELKAIRKAVEKPQ